tara:strand:+ start:248 stop:625 length:378 start_codon:yes stop_codon:yes gene_type:complete
MAKFIYLFKNKNLYNIGSTYDLDLAKRNLRPCKLLNAIEVKTNSNLLDELHNNYQANRLPGSDYFRLNMAQAKECSDTLRKSSSGKEYQPFFIGLKLWLTFLIAWLTISYLIIIYGISPVLDKFS